MALLNESHLLGDQRHLLILALFVLHLFLLEVIPAPAVDGHDQRPKLLHPAVPQRLRHTQVPPLGPHDLLHLHGGDDRVARREYAVDGAELFAGPLRVSLHAALAHDDPDAGGLDKIVLELLHAHGGGGAYGHHLEFVILQGADDGSGVEDGVVPHVHGDLPALLYHAPVGHVPAGGQAARQVHDIADVDVLQILRRDGGGQDLLAVSDFYHYSVTSE